MNTDDNTSRKKIAGIGSKASKYRVDSQAKINKDKLAQDKEIWEKEFEETFGGIAGEMEISIPTSVGTGKITLTEAEMKDNLSKLLMNDEFLENHTGLFDVKIKYNDFNEEVGRSYKIQDGIHQSTVVSAYKKWEAEKWKEKSVNYVPDFSQPGQTEKSKWGTTADKTYLVGRIQSGGNNSKVAETQLRKQLGIEGYTPEEIDNALNEIKPSNTSENNNVGNKTKSIVWPK